MQSSSPEQAHAYLSSDFSHIGFEHRNEKLPTPIQEYIHISKYSRWIEELGRRETWPETCQRYMDFMYERSKKLGSPMTEDEYRFLYESILFQRTMPSMRAMMTAGKAMEKHNMCNFNCSYCAINNKQVFSELLYISACGSGIGFSVEDKYISQLPTVASWFEAVSDVIVVEDSKIGWATAFQMLIDSLYEGKIPSWDLSKVRPNGARLKTMGGRASGPACFNKLLQFTVELFRNAKGRKLTSLECHSLACKTAEAIVSGGSRRSAAICLSDLDDNSMRFAKADDWWSNNPHFSLSNNSAVYESKPSGGKFMKEWLSIYDSKSGERGIFNRQAAITKVSKLKNRNSDYDFGCNACSEVILRYDGGTCNLSEVILREEDNIVNILPKIKAAVWFGVLQSTFTDFDYLRPVWKKNANEERLLGVSLTGIMDNIHFNHQYEGLNDTLEIMKEQALIWCKELCDRFGLNMSAAISVCKPSGTVSLLANTSAGIHARFSKQWVRAFRETKNSPVCKLLQEMGVPNEPDLMNPEYIQVFYFPAKASENSIIKDDLTAIQQLEHWLSFNRHWAEHSVSSTIYIREHEWLEVGNWVYNHFDEITGLSFLPADESGHTYKQAPYQACTKEEYEKRLSEMPTIDWSNLSKYETDDMTEGSQELACTGSGGCEI